jgi:hypothetical protein
MELRTQSVAQLLAVQHDFSFAIVFALSIRGFGLAVSSPE